MDELIKLIAKYFILAPLVVNLYIFWRLKKNRRRTMLLILIAGGALSLVLAKFGNHIYYDPRPFIKDGATPLLAHSNDNGFPSDHTLLASFLALVALGYSRKWGYVLLVIAIVIGWARVAAHIHHLVDIIGSFVITVLAYGLVKLIVERRYAGSKLK